VFNWVAQKVGELGPFNDVCEVGSRNINGTIRPAFGLCRYIGVDLIDGPDVDVIADFVTWDTAQRFDCVVTTGALEHYPNPAGIVQRAAELLKPSGVLIVTCAGPGWRPHSGVDGGDELHEGEHYCNIDTPQLGEMFNVSGFGEWELETNKQFADTLGWAQK
jgi:hypothetical protein